MNRPSSQVKCLRCHIWTSLALCKWHRCPSTSEVVWRRTWIDLWLGLNSSNRAERLLSKSYVRIWTDGRKPIARHLDFPLKPGRKQAALVVEEAQFEIYKSFDEARCYLMANIDWIMEHYGDRHQVKREDVMIVSSVYVHQLRLDCRCAVCTTLRDGGFRILTPNHPQIQRTHRVGPWTRSTMGYMEFRQASRHVQPSDRIIATILLCDQLSRQSEGISHGSSTSTWCRGSSSPLYLQSFQCIGFSTVSL